MATPARLSWGAAALLGAACAASFLLQDAAQAAPAVGSYAAHWCVAIAEAAPSCGPARVRILGPGLVRVRINDLEYRLRLQNGQVEVVLQHGTMQIDDFVSAGEWVGDSLRFTDADKHARYEVRLKPRRNARESG